ncbi:MAG: Uma2 family endonuclease [Pseudomonadota bacterium]|nr:Uma2 family endonuclease [Pseudomonadota bacterium]
MSTAKAFHISVDDYLAGEAISPVKHEYRQGSVYAMTGAKKSHVVIASNLITLLNVHLQDAPCLVFGSDIKVRLEQANCFYYPDVSVSCHEWDLETEDTFISSPVLIIEILSASTEAFDRGEKFADYRTLSSLREYVLVNQNQVRVECFRYSSAGNWQQQDYERGEVLEFVSVGLHCPIEAIYQKVGRLG